MACPLKPIEPKSPRWEPTPDPNDIVIPGLDTSAPVNDQIEQIEQLITIKLQNIDANFSRIQQIMANRILPAVKKYAVGTEPVREAAKFWTTFFEQAAQIRVPTYEDYETHQENDQTSGTEEPDMEQSSSAPSSEPASTPTRSQFFNNNETSSEVSFMPGQAAMASTPATGYRHRTPYSQYSDDRTPSWSASLESPLVRLDREIQSLALDDEKSAASSSVTQLSLHRDESEDITQRQILPTTIHELSLPNPTDKGKGKAKESSQPLLHNVLRRNASTADSSITTGHSTTVSPLKLKQKTPVFKALNPYIPPDSNPSDWKGVVDLSDRTISTPGRGLPSLPSRFTQASGKGSTTPKKFDDDDSFDENFGMSPPITLNFASLPKRGQTVPKLGQTPRKEAAERIMKNLLDIERRGGFSGARAGDAGTESSMSSVPSPPSLSRYTKPAEISSSVADASLESLMRRVGAEYGGVPTTNTTSSIGSVPSFTFKPPPSQSTSDRQSQTPEQPQLNVFRLRDPELQPPDEGEGDVSTDSLSDEEFNNTANPSAAFILASQRASYEDDDSYDSSNQSMDSLDGGQGAPVHPFAHGISAEDGDGFDDSFDDPEYGGEAEEREEETLFGVSPAEREAIAQRQGGLRMLGEELLEDTIGIGAQMANFGRVEESPTPWGGAAAKGTSG